MAEFFEELKRNIIVEESRWFDGEPIDFVNLRRAIHLAIMCSADCEEFGHKIQVQLQLGQVMTFCTWLVYHRTGYGYGICSRYYCLLAQLLCMINNIHQRHFGECLRQLYSTARQLETHKLRNVAKLYAHLLAKDALPWHLLSHVRLTEEDTTPSSRIFVKTLYQELSGHLGVPLLNGRLSDPAMQEVFESIFPGDSPEHARYAIQFLKAIGLFGLTGNLRDYVKNTTGEIFMEHDSSDDSGSDEQWRIQNFF